MPDPIPFPLPLPILLSSDHLVKCGFDWQKVFIEPIFGDNHNPSSNGLGEH